MPRGTDPHPPEERGGEIPHHAPTLAPYESRCNLQGLDTLPHVRCGHGFTQERPPCQAVRGSARYSLVAHPHQLTNAVSVATRTSLAPSSQRAVAGSSSLVRSDREKPATVRAAGGRRRDDPSWRAGRPCVPAALCRAGAALANPLRPNPHAGCRNDPRGWRWRPACADTRRTASYPAPVARVVADVDGRDSTLRAEGLQIDKPPIVGHEEQRDTTVPWIAAQRWVGAFQAVDLARRLVDEVLPLNVEVIGARLDEALPSFPQPPLVRWGQSPDRWPPSFAGRPLPWSSTLASGSP